MALASASFASPLTSHFQPGPFILGGGGGETDEDRRLRNLKAGGRDKRIKRNKARRSFGRMRRTRSAGGPRLSNPFLKNARRDAFDSSLKNLAFMFPDANPDWVRRQAMKVARRVEAHTPKRPGRSVPVHASGPSPVPNPPHRSGAIAA